MTRWMVTDRQRIPGGWLSVGALCIALGYCCPTFPSDCNSNDVEDDIDIAGGFSEDCNKNAVPDECDGLPVAFSLADEVIELAPVPRYLEAADLDGDSRLDLVVGSRDANLSTLTVLLSRGLQQSRVFNVTEYPLEGLSYSATTTDLDRDGDLDLATAHGDALLVFTNDGDGRLSEPVRYEQVLPTREVAAADLTGDGLPDLIAAQHGERTITFHANAGDGAFLPAQTLEVGNDPRAIATADFDGNGTLDVATANRNSGGVSILLNRGADGFAPAVEYPLGERLPFALEAQDLNRDGAPDLLAASSQVAVALFGRGDGTLLVNERYPALGAWALTVADVDGDQDPDLVFVRGVSGILVRQNDGQGNFRVAVDQGGLGTAPTNLALSDGQNGGDTELAVLASPSSVQFLVNDGASQLGVTRETYRPLPGCIGNDPSCKPHGGNVADLDGDGDTDVIASSTEPGAFSLLINDGTGRMDMPPAYTFDGSEPLYTAVGDLDGDGDIDPVTADAPCIWVHLNRGDATFLDPRTTLAGGGTIHVELVDLDGDSHLDAVTTNRNEGTVRPLFGLGDGTFDDGVGYRVGRRPNAVAVGDFDFDGDLDLAVANSDANHVSVLSNGGDRTFSVGTDLHLAGRPHFVAAGDLDGDGDVDLATANHNTANSSVLINSDGGVFLPPADFPTGPAPFSVFLLDYDVNGIQDLGTANEAGSSVSILLGRGDGTYDRPRVLLVGGGPRFAYPADFDGDGDPDLVSIDREGHSLTIIHNELRRDEDLTLFLETICTGAGFHRFSARSVRGDRAERFLHYTLPVDVGASPLPAVVFQNSARFALPEDFLRAVFPETFPTLTAANYRDLVEFRATRKYFAGRIRRFPTEKGLLYGFTVDAGWSDPAESLRVDEVRELYTRLRESFLLEPFAYAPDTAAAAKVADAWGEDPGFRIYSTPNDRQPAPDSPTFELSIPPGSVTCGTFDIGREPRKELELKSRLELTAGSVSLPTEAERFPATIVGELAFGPAGDLATPEGPGRFRIAEFPLGEGSVVYRFAYEQGFTLPTGGRLVVELSPLDFRVDRGEPVMERLVLDQGLSNESVFLRARLERGEERADIFYAPCQDESLPLWEIRAELEDGATMRLAERYRPEFVRDFGPASLVEAEVEVGGRRVVVSDYFRLVYSARRHNRRAVYWTVLEPPLPVRGVEKPVHAVELRAPVKTTGESARASYLGENLQVIATLDVRAFEKEEFAATARFRRGDLDGDGKRNITDALGLLRYLFRRGEAPVCRKAADANDDGRIHLLDAVALVSSFLGGRMPLPEPAECGTDPTPDTLPCRSQCE